MVFWFVSDLSQGIAATQAQAEIAAGLDFGTDEVDFPTFKAKIDEVFK